MFADDDVAIPDGVGFDLNFWRDLFPYSVVNDIGWTHSTLWTTQGCALCILKIGTGPIIPIVSLCHTIRFQQIIVKKIPSL